MCARVEVRVRGSGSPHQWVVAVRTELGAEEYLDDGLRAPEPVLVGSLTSGLRQPPDWLVEIDCGAGSPRDSAYANAPSRAPTSGPTT